MANGNGRRTTDASKLSFPLQLVVLIASTCATAAGTIQWTQSGITSDIRNISTRIEHAAEVAKLQTDLNKERADALAKAVEAMKAEIRMTQIDVQSLKESLLKMEQKP